MILILFDSEVNSEGVPIRSTLDTKQTTSYSALISQLTAKARAVVRDLDPQVQLIHNGM